MIFGNAMRSTGAVQINGEMLRDGGIA